MKIVVMATDAERVNVEALRSELDRLLTVKFGLRIRRLKVKA